MRMSAEALDDLVLLINNRSLEKDKRILLAAAARAYGHGGKKRVKDLTGMAFSTLHRGKNDVKEELMRSNSDDCFSEMHPVTTDEEPPASNTVQKPTRHTGSKLKDPTKTMDGRDRQRKVHGARLGMEEAVRRPHCGTAQEARFFLRLVKRTLHHG